MKISFEEHFAWRWNFVRGKLCMAWKFCFKNTLDGTEDSGPEAWAGTFPQRRTWGDLVIFELLRSVLFLKALWLIELPSSYCHRINWNGKNIQNEFWVARLNKTCDCTTGRRNIPDAKHVHPLSSPFQIYLYICIFVYLYKGLECWYVLRIVYCLLGLIFPFTHEKSPWGRQVWPASSRHICQTSQTAWCSFQQIYLWS